MLPLCTLNSVKERGSNGALRSHLFAKGRTRRGGSRYSKEAMMNEIYRGFSHIKASTLFSESRNSASQRSCVAIGATNIGLVSK